MRGCLMVLALGLATPILANEAPVAPSLSLKIVDRAQFCVRLGNIFANYGQTSGYDRMQTTLLASGATASVMQEFKAGRATDFINANALAQFSNVPTKNADDSYLPLAGIVAGAMGIAGEATLALSPAELRFIPFAPKGLDLIVIAQNAAAITPERAKRVSELARSMNIKIHVIWVGAVDESSPAIAEARSLAWLAATTGGSFANLGGSTNPCAEAS